MSVFGVHFTSKTCLIPDTFFTRVDATHFVLDIASTVQLPHTTLNEISLFLLTPQSLAPEVALALYVSVGDQNWSFRGYISNSHPSDVLPLSWPVVDDLNPRAQIGVQLEPLAEVAQKESAKLGAKEEFVKFVGLDLFNFMQSFGGVAQVGSDKLLVPTNCLDKWYARISHRLQIDPDFLTRQKNKI